MPNRDRALAFLTEIGLPWSYGNPGKSFIEHVAILDGGLVIDEEKAHVSDVLHEAGHLAIVPARLRQNASGNLNALFIAIGKAIEETPYEDWSNDAPAAKALLQTGDPEATAWAWAAGIHLGIEPEEIIQDHQYDDAGEHVRLMLSARQYLGINGLRAGGMVKDRDYPVLTRWLQN